MQPDRDFYTIVELASFFKVSRDTVDRWIKRGQIAFVRLPSGHYRIPHAELERLCAVRKVSDGSESRKRDEASA